MALVPTPATTVARSPTASLTARRMSPSSATLVVGDSPVVPETTTPSWPWSTRCAAIRAVPSRSTEPSSWNAVAIAVSTRPKGAAVVMGSGYPRGAPLPPLAPRGSARRRHGDTPGPGPSVGGIHDTTALRRGWDEVRHHVDTAANTTEESAAVPCRCSASGLPRRGPRSRSSSAGSTARVASRWSRPTTRQLIAKDAATFSPWFDFGVHPVLRDRRHRHDRHRGTGVHRLGRVTRAQARSHHTKSKPSWRSRSVSTHSARSKSG